MKASSVNIHIMSFAKIISPKEEKCIISTLVERKKGCSSGRYYKDPEEEKQRPNLFWCSFLTKLYIPLKTIMKKQKQDKPADPHQQDLLLPFSKGKASVTKHTTYCTELLLQPLNASCLDCCSSAVSYRDWLQPAAASVTIPQRSLQYMLYFSEGKKMHPANSREKMCWNKAIVQHFQGEDMVPGIVPWHSLTFL